MADRGGKSASRKTARALPMTHRQHKMTKRRQPEAGASSTTTSASASPRQQRAQPAAKTRRQPSLTPPRLPAEQSAPRLVLPSSVKPAGQPTGEHPSPRRARPSRAQTQPITLVAPITPVAPVAPETTPELAPVRAASDDTGAPASDMPLLAPASSPEGEQSSDAPVYTAALLAPDVAAAEMTSPGALVADAAMLVAPSAVTPAEPTAEPTAEPAAEPTAEADTLAELAEEESAPTTPLRKMPTLAVMAALAPRAEAPAPADDEDTTPRLRAVRPTAPLTEPERLPAQDIPDAASAEVASAAEESAAPSLAAPAALEDAPQTSGSEAAPAAPSADAAPAAGSDASAPESATSRMMWWTQAARRRAAPETRPIAAVAWPGASAQESAEVTAPQRATHRPPAAPVATRAPAPRTERTERAERRVDASHADASFSRRAQTTGARLRARAIRSPRMVVLSWTAGGQVALACVAALIAVIAALRSSAGPDALAVFNWALALALIVGLGAALGYIWAQTGRPRLATLALALSQLGALTWALGLLGPRAALLALAPASAALALRGAGRLSAVAVALGWLALFIADEALTLTGALTPPLPLSGVGAALVDVALPLVGLWMAVSILNSLYISRLNVVARGRAVEHAALLTEAQLDRLRTQTEDDAEALRRALAQALRGEQPERVYAHGALSVVADEVNAMADRLIDLRYDRAERKRLESATRRLTRVIERAWLGLSWSWPDATGTILDDLLALLRTPPPPDTPDLLDDTAPTGQVVAPHLFRGWQAAEPEAAAPRTQPDLTNAPSVPSVPSLPSLWPSDPGLGLTDPLELPPSPRWRGSDAVLDPPDRPGSSTY